MTHEESELRVTPGGLLSCLRMSQPQLFQHLDAFPVLLPWGGTVGL